MPTAPKLLALVAGLVTSALAGCDSDAATSTDYRVVLHADVTALRASPLVAAALKDDALQIDGDLGACAELLRTATAVTVGADEGAFEVYVEGKFTAKAAKSCSEHVATQLAAKGAKTDARVDTTVVADGLFAVHRGPAKPSRARMTSLRSADPSPGKQAAWLVAHDDDDKDEVEHVEAWISAGKAIDAHLDVHFDSATAATEIYGQAAIGLTALRLSSEMGELAKAISVSSAGDTLTAEFHASNELVRKLIDAGRVKAKAAARADEDHSGSISVEIH